MNISLDFDDTITRDGIAWRHFCEYFISRGHNVYIVTWRDEEQSKEIREYWSNIVTGVYCTDRVAKEKYMYSKGIRIDVWIDDLPSAILFGRDDSFPEM